MSVIKVRTQDQLDKALANATDDDLIACVGNGYFSVTGSATVDAWDSATVDASDSATVRASKYVAVHKMSPSAVVRGGVVIEPPSIDSPETWLDYHGVEVKRGLVTLYKAVDGDWHANHALPDGTMPSYAPGSKPEAPDFDPASRDCGRGLHGCARPCQALDYKSDATKFVAIPVRVKDLGCPDPDGDTDKIRFRCAAKPCYEVDIDGEPVQDGAA